MKIILNKYISQSGYCSRRQAEVFIKKREVFVNGRVAEPGMKVDENDEVKIKSKIINPESEKIYIILNKPAGYTCTNREFKNEKNVFDLLPKEITKEHKLFVAGRLDKNSRGLVLITNDGELTQKITHPKYKHEKKYKVQISLSDLDSQKEISDKIKQLKKGVDIGEGDGVVKAENISYLGKGFFNIILTQGKKRQIRRMFDAVGWEIKDLCRVGLGNMNLDKLPSGKWKFITKNDIK